MAKEHKTRQIVIATVEGITQAEAIVSILGTLGVQAIHRGVPKTEVLHDIIILDDFPNGRELAASREIITTISAWFNLTTVANY